MTTNKISTSATAHKPATGEIEQLMQKMQQTRSPADAEALARKAVSLKPERAELHLALATALHMQGKASEAEAAYGECLKRDRKNVRALINLGSLQIDGGQPAAASRRSTARCTCRLTTPKPCSTRAAGLAAWARPARRCRFSKAWPKSSRTMSTC
jgi:Tfp pilus assembly protein PilF